MQGRITPQRLRGDAICSLINGLHEAIVLPTLSKTFQSGSITKLYGRTYIIQIIAQRHVADNFGDTNNVVDLMLIT